MYGLVYNDPRLRQVVGDRGEAELGYQFVGAIFAFAAFVFFLSWVGASSRERRSVAFSLTAITTIVSITYGFIIPNRLGLTFQDLNGNPLDIAPHWEALMLTPILIHIMGEITKNRQMAFVTASWNYPVYVFGILGMVITTTPMSPLMLWLSVGSFSIVIKYIGKMFSLAGQSGSSMNETSLTMAKYAACLLYTSPSPRDLSTSRMPSSA